MSTYQYLIKATDRLHEESLKEFVSHSQLHHYIKVICDEFDEECHGIDLFKADPWSASKPMVIFKVNERIRLANLIKPNLNSTHDEKYLTHPLFEYLLLTCIDHLGQPFEWLSFDSWLKSKKKKEERNKIINELGEVENIAFATKLYQGYLEIYGVKNSFFNFFNSIINDFQKDKFLSQITIEIYENYLTDFLFKLGNGEDKIKYLYKVRNDYTHKTKPTGPHILIFPESTDAKGWYEKDMIYSNNTSKIKITKNYYDELENTIKAGIWEFIKISLSN